MKAPTLLLAAVLPLACAQLPYITFGTGRSQGRLTQTETSLFSYSLTPGSTHGVIQHWWITGGGTIDNAIISMYIDGEAVPSIQFVPSLACGVGFNDESLSPWSNALFSKESHTSAWSSKVRIPFQSSINVTYKSGPGQADDVIYMIVRGTENLPITVGGVVLPSTARMNLHVTQGAFPPLAFVNVVPTTSGQGAFLMHTLSFSAPNLNTLEGCHHAYFNNDTTYPGMIVSTGTEDGFDSSYYFDGGKFIGANSGMTHVFTNASYAELSAYRIYDADPIFFQAGFSFMWRNGDVTDPATGLKCTSLSGNTVGSPGVANVNIYAWYYTW